MNKVQSNSDLAVGTFINSTQSLTVKESVHKANPDDVLYPSHIIQCANATSVNKLKISSGMNLIPLR